MGGKLIREGKIGEVTDERRRHEFFHAAEVAGRIGAFEYTQPNGRSHWSDGLYEVLGIDPCTTAASGDLFMSVVYVEDRAKLAHAFQQAVEEKHSLLQIKYRIIRVKDGAVRWVRSTGEFIYQGECVRFIGTTQDITELHEAEAEVQEQRQKLLSVSKLNTLGELASGIGHEINTPLSGVLSKVTRVAHALANESLDDPQARARSNRLLAESISLIGRIAQIVDGLKQLSQPHAQEISTSTDPRLAVEQALSLSRARFSNHGIRIEVRSGLKSETFPMVFGKPSSLFQVMVNLLNNAFDALEARSSGGLVRIEYHERDPGELAIWVSDNGSGIADDFVPLLFEPFQTTKPEGRGTGLGLTISRRLMRAQAGELARVAAPDGFTTCFEILLKKNSVPENSRDGVDSKSQVLQR